MKKYGVILALILAAAIAIPVFADGNGDAKAGKAVYAKRCATCHGPEGVAKESIEKMFKAEMHALGSKEVQAKSDAELQKIVTEGKGKMKPVKDVSAQDMANLIAYIRTLAKH